MPLIVISPYAKAGYVSHASHEFGSFLHFTEERYGLRSLGYTMRARMHLLAHWRAEPPDSD